MQQLMLQLMEASQKFISHSLSNNFKVNSVRNQSHFDMNVFSYMLTYMRVC